MIDLERSLVGSNLFSRAAMMRRRFLFLLLCNLAAISLVILWISLSYSIACFNGWTSLSITDLQLSGLSALPPLELGSASAKSKELSDAINYAVLGVGLSYPVIYYLFGFLKLRHIIISDILILIPMLLTWNYIYRVTSCLADYKHNQISAIFRKSLEGSSTDGVVFRSSFSSQKATLISVDGSYGEPTCRSYVLVVGKESECRSINSSQSFQRWTYAKDLSSYAVCSHKNGINLLVSVVDVVLKDFKDNNNVLVNLSYFARLSDLGGHQYASLLACIPDAHI